jgi:hypothetical protein
MSEAQQNPSTSLEKNFHKEETFPPHYEVE